MGVLPGKAHTRHLILGEFVALLSEGNVCFPPHRQDACRTDVMAEASAFRPVLVGTETLKMPEVLRDHR